MNLWWPQLVLHTWREIGADFLTAMAEVMRPTPAVPPACPPGCPLAEFMAWNWDDSALPRERS